MNLQKLFLAMAVVLMGGLLAPVPAQADHARPGDHVLGHRCRTAYDPAATNENTVAALRDTAGVPGAICEIDVYRISDGTLIVWHDATWNRVADHRTLPAGVGPRDRIVQATAAQVRQIRTKGGEPVPTLEEMIAAAGQYDIPLVVDIRNSLGTNASRLVTLANQRGADVRYYQLVRSSCNTGQIDRFRAVGATVGIKLLGQCPMTPAQIAAKGASFTQELSFRLTDAYLAEMNRRSIQVGVLDRGMTEVTAESLENRGVSKFLLDAPRDALTWFDND